MRGEFPASLRTNPRSGEPLACFAGRCLRKRADPANQNPEATLRLKPGTALAQGSEENVGLITPTAMRPSERAVAMLIHELNRAECFALLQRNSVGRLGYARFEQPHIVPIHFSFDADRNYVYGFSTVGEKVDSMRRNPRVCLEVDEIVDKNHWTTVLVVGRYREIHRDPREAEALRRAEQLFRDRDEWWLPG